MNAKSGMKTFLFYDIETSGLNPAFDQILTFAAIRTDLDLNEIERQEITIQLRRDIVPSPMAFLTHGLTFKQLQKGVCEYEAALKIHSIVNRPGTISLGYNSLGFDDVFLRFLFYRNLLDPYTHQYSSGCSRMDVLPITVLYHLFSPDGVNWPTIEGKTSLKLENISSENQFDVSGRAHEAMSDVEAVIALCRIFIQNRDIWEYGLNFFNKTRDNVRIGNIEEAFCVGQHSFRVCLMLSAAFGPDHAYMAPVIHLGQSRAYKNQELWLRLDTDNILGLDDNSDVADISVIRKKPADQWIVLPALERFWKRLPSEVRSKTGKNMERVQGNESRLDSVIDYHSRFKYPFIPDMDIDASLYQDGFFSAQEKKESIRFHQALKTRKTGLIEEISNPRIRHLAMRILYRNSMEGLEKLDSEDAALLLERLVECLKSCDPDDRIVGYKNDVKLNVEDAAQQLEEIRKNQENFDAGKSDMIEQLEKYIRGLRSPAA